MQKNNVFNYIINIDKYNNKYYNEGGKSNIEIFTIKEYKLYKEKYEFNCSMLMEDLAEYKQVNHPHDKSFRKALDIKSEAVWLINKELGEKGKVTEEEIEKYNSSFITERFKNLEADVIYKIKNKDIFFLIEHQTKVDYTMPLRILEYEMAIIYSCLKRQKSKNSKYRYPAVIPIVLYTGKKKWKVAKELKEVQQSYKQIQGEELSRYNIFDNNKYSEEKLLNENTLIAQLMLIEKAKNENRLENNLIKIVKKVKDMPDIVYTKEKREILKNVIDVLLKTELGKEKVEKYLKELNVKEKEEWNMERVFEMLEREKIKRERRLEKAVKKSRSEGIKEGIQRDRQEIAKNMRKEKMPIKLIIKLTGLKEEEIKQLS